ncbi:mRNA-capping enzyme [Chionoecetes opilio]|uniref:mRNA-capping enzyme n=1 Tax=Chionoecetes opilio TaxID=41210 RepID=A0A8J4YXN9_CHIOP|nr:mRNA-capping enzyme [Chionoecetes opilio]
MAACPRKSQTLIGGKFLVFKTPLISQIDDEVPKNTKKKERFYVKLKCGGHGECPNEDQVSLFTDICEKFIRKNPLEIIEFETAQEHGDSSKGVGGGSGGPGGKKDRQKRTHLRRHLDLPSGQHKLKNTKRGPTRLSREKGAPFYPALLVRMDKPVPRVAPGVREVYFADRDHCIFQAAEWNSDRSMTHEDVKTHKRCDFNLKPRKWHDTDRNGVKYPRYPI